MSLVIKDRCKQRIATGAGTGSVTLTSSVKGFKTISSALSDGATSYFCLESGNGDWEVFIGSYSSSGTTISRDTVLASSNSGNKIDIGSSITFCYIVLPADKVVYKDSANRTVIGSAGLIFSDSTIQTTAPTAPNWGSIGGTLSNQTDLVSALALKATLASPSLTGVPTAPTAVGGTNTTQLATTAFVTSSVGAIDLSPYLTISSASSTYQPLDSDLTAIAALTTTSFGRSLLTQADAAATRSTIGAGIGDALTSNPLSQFAITTSSQLASVVSDETGTGSLVFASSPTLVSPAVGTASANDNSTRAASTAYVDSAVSSAVAGLLDFKGNTDASSNPNYPSASKGDTYYISVAGKIGGASGKSVDIGDAVIANADNAGGTEASVGTSWFVLEHNLTGALLSANNLSDLASVSTARTNLGLGTLATQNGTFSGTSSGSNTGDQDLSSYLTTASAASTYLPYTGANTAINLGSQYLHLQSNTLAIGTHAFSDRTNLSSTYLASYVNEFCVYVGNSKSLVLSPTLRLEQRNSTNAQTFEIYNTYTSATSLETFRIKANAGAAYQIGSAIGSAGGTNRNISVGHYNSSGTFSSAFTVDTLGQVTVGTGTPTRIFNVTGGVAYFERSGLWFEINPNQALSGTTAAFDCSKAMAFYVNSAIAPALALMIAATGAFTFTPTIQTSGSPTALTLTGAAHTTLTASTEATDVNFNLARTVQFATGALTTQRAMRIQAPTYSFVGASTITTASTLSISGPPVAGTNATITNAYALNVESGYSKFASHIYGASISVTPQSANPTIYASNTPNNTGFWCSGDSVGTCYGGGVFMSYAHTNPGATCTFNYNTDIVLGADTTYGKLRWASSLSIGYDAANILGQRNGTSAQTSRIYNTYTSSTSYERGVFDWQTTANTLRIGTEKGSTGGTARDLVLVTDATARVTIAASTGIISTVTTSAADIQSIRLYSGATEYGAIRCDTRFGGTLGWIGCSAGYQSSAGILWNQATNTVSLSYYQENTSLKLAPSCLIFVANNISIFAANTTSVSLYDAIDFVVGTTTGTKIGTATSQKLGFWNVTPIIQPASANQIAITDSTGGSTGDTTIVDVGLVFSQANINDNFAKVTKLLNQVRADLVSAGLIKGTA